MPSAQLEKYEEAKYYQQFSRRIGALEQRADAAACKPMEIFATEPLRRQACLFPLELVSSSEGERCKAKLEALNDLGEKSIQHFRRICKRPQSFLKSINEVRPIDTVKRIGYEAFAYLAGHSEDWQARTVSGLVPARLFSRVEDTDYCIYENCLLFSAVEEYTKQLRQLKRNAQDCADALRLADDFYEERRPADDYDIWYWKTWKAWFRSVKKNPDAVQENAPLRAALYGQIQRAEAFLSAFDSLRAEKLYRYIKPARRVNLYNRQSSNLLLFDKDYRQVNAFCRELEEVKQKFQAKKDTESAQTQILTASCYSLYCKYLIYFVLSELGFKYIAKQGNTVVLKREADFMHLLISAHQLEQTGAQRLTITFRPGYRLSWKEWEEQGLKVDLNEPKFNNIRGKLSLQQGVLFWTDKQTREQFFELISPQRARNQQERNRQYHDKNFLRLRETLRRLAQALEAAEKATRPQIPLHFDPVLTLDDFAGQQEWQVLLYPPKQIDASGRSEETGGNPFLLNRLTDDARAVHSEKTKIIASLKDTASYRRVQKIIASVLQLYALPDKTCPYCGNKLVKHPHLPEWECTHSYPPEGGRPAIAKCRFTLREQQCPNHHRYFYTLLSEPKARLGQQSGRDFVPLVQTDDGISASCPQCQGAPDK